MSSVVIAGNTSGSITISAPDVSGSNTLTLPVATDTLVGKATTDTLTNKTLVDPTITDLQTLNTPNTFGFKNRIINGGMVISQRNGTTATTTADDYPVDRFQIANNSAATFSSVQSTTAPAGFTNSFLFTVTSADSSVTGADRTFIRHRIEGYNVSDLGFGTASAKTITLSAQVYSSVTGTFGGAILNNTEDRSFAFTYSIPVANTWTPISITITGDTTGTWLTTNGRGINVLFSLGMGSSLTTAAGSWTAGQFYSATGCTNLISTSGATFYITGVQLEKGSTATSFDFRPYTTELQLCQRYLPAWQAGGNSNAQVPGSATALVTNVYMLFPFPVTARAAPTGITLSNVAHMSFGNNDGNAACTVSTGLAQSSSFAANFTFTVAVTRGATTTPGWLYANNTSLSFYFTGCEL